MIFALFVTRHEYLDSWNFSSITPRDGGKAGFLNLDRFSHLSDSIGEIDTDESDTFLRPRSAFGTDLISPNSPAITANFKCMAAFNISGTSLMGFDDGAVALVALSLIGP